MANIPTSTGRLVRTHVTRSPFKSCIVPSLYLRSIGFTAASIQRPGVCIHSRNLETPRRPLVHTLVRNTFRIHSPIAEAQSVKTQRFYCPREVCSCRQPVLHWSLQTGNNCTTGSTRETDPLQGRTSMIRVRRRAINHSGDASNSYTKPGGLT